MKCTICGKGRIRIIQPSGGLNKRASYICDECFSYFEPDPQEGGLKHSEVVTERLKRGCDMKKFKVFIKTLPELSDRS